MSLVRTVLRLLTVKALIGQTVAADRVRESDISPMSDVLADNPQPVIVVYTDDHGGEFEGKSLFSSRASHVTLTIQLSVAGAYKMDDPGSNGFPDAFAFIFSPLSTGLELQLDSMEYHAKAALQDPGNPWGQLWSSLVLGVGKWSSLRGGSDQEGARFAVRQVSIEVETADDPVPGAAPSKRWQAIIDAIAADPDPDFAGFAPLIKATIGGRRTLAEAERAIMSLGMTTATARAIGIGGVVDDAGALARIEVEDGDGDVAAEDAP